MANTSATACSSRGRPHCGSRRDILKQIDADLIAVEEALQRRRQSLAEIDRRLGELQLSPPAAAAAPGLSQPPPSSKSSALTDEPARPSAPPTTPAPPAPPTLEPMPAPLAAPSAAARLLADAAFALLGPEPSDAPTGSMPLEVGPALPAPPSFAEWLQEHKDFCAAIQKAKRDEENQERELRSRRQRLQGQLADLQERFFKGESLDVSGLVSTAGGKSSPSRSSAATAAAAANASSGSPLERTARSPTDEGMFSEAALLGLASTSPSPPRHSRRLAAGWVLPPAQAQAAEAMAAEAMAACSAHAVASSQAATTARPPSPLPPASRTGMAAPTHRLPYPLPPGAVAGHWEPISGVLTAPVGAAPSEPSAPGLRPCRSAPALPMGAMMRMSPAAIAAAAAAAAALPPGAGPAFGSARWAPCGAVGAAMPEPGALLPPMSQRLGKSLSPCVRPCAGHATAPVAAALAVPAVGSGRACCQSRSLSPTGSAAPPWVPVSLRMPLPAVMAMAAGAHVTTIVGHGPMPPRTFAFVKDSERERAATPSVPAPPPHLLHAVATAPAPVPAAAPAEAPSPAPWRPLTNLAPVPGCDAAMYLGVPPTADFGLPESAFEPQPQPPPPAPSGVALPGWSLAPTLQASVLPSMAPSPSRSASYSTLYAGFASMDNSPGEASFPGSAVAQFTPAPPPPPRPPYAAAGATTPHAAGSCGSSPAAAVPRNIASAATFAVPARVPGLDGGPSGMGAMRQASAPVLPSPTAAQRTLLARPGAAWGALPAVISHSASTDKTSGQRSFTEVSGSSFAEGLEQWRPRAGHGSFQARAEAMFATPVVGATMGLGGPNTTYTGPQPLPRAQPQCPVQ